MITTGAISISNMMMVNHSLQELYLSKNSIGNDGISAIARELRSCNINTLDVRDCGITLTGARLLAESLTPHVTIRELWLKHNPISVEGAQLIVEAAVYNRVTLHMYIDSKYKSGKMKEMLTILYNRMEQEVKDYVVT